MKEWSLVEERSQSMPGMLFILRDPGESSTQPLQQVRSTHCQKSFGGFRCMWLITLLQCSMWRNVLSNRGKWSKILSHRAKQWRQQLNFLTVTYSLQYTVPFVRMHCALDSKVPAQHRRHLLFSLERNLYSLVSSIQESKFLKCTPTTLN